jgi:hypothetical protein
MSEQIIAFLSEAWLFLQTYADLFYRMSIWRTLVDFLCHFGFFLEYVCSNFWYNYEALILSIAQDENLKWKVSGTLLWSIIFMTYYRMKK